MTEKPDVLKRLEEIEKADSYDDAFDANVAWAVQLCRALLESNQALAETHGLPCLGLDPRHCPDVLRAEAVRRGEGL